MRQYEMFELEFEGDFPSGSEAVIDFSAEFAGKSEDGQTDVKVVKGFYDGNGSYKVRFYPSVAGIYKWKTFGIISAEGSQICEPARKTSHGIVRAVGTHFEHEDGTLFKPFGTTIYALNHQEQSLIDTTMNTLAENCFNKVRHCVFPKHYDFNHNDPEFYPFEKDENGNWDVHHPCFSFWNHFEQGIFQLAKMGIQTDLILFHAYDKWGFDRMSPEEDRVYLDYAIRRLAAIPEIWWSMANEYELCVHKSMEDWYVIEGFIAANDPYHHLLSNHNCMVPYDFSRENISHVCVQSTFVQNGDALIRKYGKPVINDECCYEGDLQHDWGSLSGFEMVHRIWALTAVGAYATHGEVFRSEDEVLWWAKGGTLKGQSPKRIAFLKQIVDEMDGVLTPWEVDPEVMMADYFSAMDPEKVKEIQKVQEFFAKYTTEADQTMNEIKGKEFMGRCEDRVFLKYLGHHCSSVTDIFLPEHLTYKVEVIDIWDMTRTEILAGVSGKIKAELPGKEGIAVLCTVMK